MITRTILLSPALLLIACRAPVTQPSPRPSSPPAQAPGPAAIWTQADLEVTADCLYHSGDPYGKQLSASVNSSLLALARAKSAPGFNQAAFQLQLDVIGKSLSTARAQGSLDADAGACIKY